MSLASKPETVLRNAIREALLRIGVAVMTNAQVGRTHHGGLGPGSADLIAIVRGRFVGLEVKTDDGHPSAQQLAWGEWVTEHGGAYHIVRSVADALAVVQQATRRSA